MNVTAPALNLAPLLDVQGCCKSFRKPDGDELVVLENVNLPRPQREIHIVQDDQLIPVGLAERLTAALHVQEWREIQCGGGDVHGLLLDVQGCCKSFRKPDGDEIGRAHV